MLADPIIYGCLDCLENCELDNGLSTNVCVLKIFSFKLYRENGVCALYYLIVDNGFKMSCVEEGVQGHS